MKVGIMQPYFMPYIAYYQIIKSVDVYVVYDDVNYIKKGWINRNNLIINSEKKLFSISLSGASQNKLINEIEIVDDFSKFLKTIEANYKKAPFFSTTFELIYSIINYEERNLSQFLFNSIKKTLTYLNVNTELLMSSDIVKNNNLKGEEKIIAICKALNANIYTNPIGGEALYSRSNFQIHNIDLLFLKTELVKYKQFNNQFIPFLSIIDTMMFNTPEQINIILDSYTLV